MGTAVSSQCVCCCGGKEPVYDPWPPDQVASFSSLPDVDAVRNPAPVVEEVWRGLFTQQIECTPRLLESSSPNVIDGDSLGAQSSEDETVTGPAVSKSSAGPTIPKPPAAVASTNRTSKRRGSEWWNDLKLRKDDGTAPEEVTVLCTQDLRADVSVKQLADLKWRVHGVLLEKVLQKGMKRLDRMLVREGIHDLPRNEFGMPVLLRESLLADLLTGQRHLKTVPQTDAAAAQKDLIHLSLRQLLRLRVCNLDFAAGGNNVHATFLKIMDSLIYQRLGQQAADSFAPSELVSAKKLGKELVMLMAVSKSLPSSTPPCWACCFQDRRIFFHTDRLSCTELPGVAFSEGRCGGVMEFIDKSEVDRNGVEQKVFLDLIVVLVKSESDLRARYAAVPKVLPPTHRSGAGSQLPPTHRSGADSPATTYKLAYSSLRPVQRQTTSP